MRTIQKYQLFTARVVGHFPFGMQIELLDPDDGLAGVVDQLAVTDKRPLNGMEDYPAIGSVIEVVALENWPGGRLRFGASRTLLDLAMAAGRLDRRFWGKDQLPKDRPAVGSFIEGVVVSREYWGLEIRCRHHGGIIYGLVENSLVFDDLSWTVLLEMGTEQFLRSAPKVGSSVVGVVQPYAPRDQLYVSLRQSDVGKATGGG